MTRRLQSQYSVNCCVGVRNWMHVPGSALILDIVGRSPTSNLFSIRVRKREEAASGPGQTGPR